MIRPPALAEGILLPMFDRARVMLAEAMQLPPPERAERVADLTAGLDGEPHENVEAVWSQGRAGRFV